jgi:uncharacterized protein (DUF2141 family)
MNRRHVLFRKFVGWTLALPALLLVHGALARAQSGAAVRLDVSAFRNADGALGCRLFSDGKGFPDGEGTKTTRAAISGTKASCEFGSLPPGTYAVVVIHDENGNGRLDRNLLGIPSEGYGVTNNRTYAMTSPKWDESTFSLAVGEPLVLRVVLRY